MAKILRSGYANMVLTPQEVEKARAINGVTLVSFMSKHSTDKSLYFVSFDTDELTKEDILNILNEKPEETK